MVSRMSFPSIPTPSSSPILDSHEINDNKGLLVIETLALELAIGKPEILVKEVLLIEIKGPLTILSILFKLSRFWIGLIDCKKGHTTRGQ